MSTQAPTSSEEPLVYQPLSGFAVAGFAIGIAYAVILLFAALRSFIQGDPLLMEGYWLLLPLAGVILSVLGQVHIRNSEGTRAGHKLTRWGLGLSVCFGLSYFVYSLGTGLAIRHQANRFLMDEGDESGFFPHLIKSKRSPADFNAAFLLTLKPQERQGANPKNIDEVRERFSVPDAEFGGSALSRFADNPLVLFFARGAESELRVEPLGVMDWQYTKSGFVLRRAYRIRNEEAVADVKMTVLSAEGREGETRKWMVNIKPDGFEFEKIELTDAGRAMERIRNRIGVFLMAWLNNEKSEEKWAGFANLDTTSWDTLFKDKLDLGKSVRKTVGVMLDEKRSAGLPLSPKLKESTWQRDQGKLKVQIPIELRLPPEISLMGIMEVASKENVAHLTDGPKLSWEISGIRFDQVALKAPPKGI